MFSDDLQSRQDARNHRMHSEHFAINVGEISRIINVLESNK